MINDPKFEELKDKIIIAIDGKIGDDEMIFTINNGEKYKLFHRQECCERVAIVDITGDLNDLIDLPILLAEEITSDSGDILLSKDLEDYVHDETSFGSTDGTSTWTFYKLSTIKGSVTIRWLGTSNGYYSESVDFIKIKPMLK